MTIILLLLQLHVTPFKYKERRPWPSEAQVRPTPPNERRKVLKPKGLLQSPPGGARLVPPAPKSIGTIPGQMVHVSKEEVVDNVHIGDVAKYIFYDQVTLQARTKEDHGAVTWAEPVMVQFPTWMKGHAVGRDPEAVFIGGTLHQIKRDSHSYVQTWCVHGGQLKQAKRVQWSRVAGYLPITDAAVVAEVDGAMESWKLLLAGKVGGKRETETGAQEGYDTDQTRHGSRMSRAKKPKLGAKGGPSVTMPTGPTASPSAAQREHLKDTQQQLRARIEELEKVRKQSDQAQKAAEDMLREERAKWEDERREKDNEIRDLREKLKDASVRASKKGAASPGPREGGKDVEDQKNFLQLAAMEIKDGLVQATTSIEELRDSLIDARGKESTQGEKTPKALTSLRDKYTVQSLQLGKAAEEPGGSSSGGGKGRDGGNGS